MEYPGKIHYSCIDFAKYDLIKIQIQYEKQTRSIIMNLRFFSEIMLWGHRSNFLQYEYIFESLQKLKWRANHLP